MKNTTLLLGAAGLFGFSLWKLKQIRDAALAEEQTVLADRQDLVSELTDEEIDILGL